MASRAFIFLSEGAPWVRTWVSRGRLVFVLHGGGIAVKCARMSVVGPVFIAFDVFGIGPGSPASPLLLVVGEGFADGKAVAVGTRVGRVLVGSVVGSVVESISGEMSVSVGSDSFVVRSRSRRTPCQAVRRRSCRST